LMQCQVTSGLTLTDRIALPVGNVKEGLPTTNDITALLSQYGDSSGNSQGAGNGLGTDSGSNGLGYGENEGREDNAGDQGNTGFGFGDGNGDDIAVALAGGDEI
ncbi:MAG: hypothetical protein ACSW8H_04120, partial [bacterium]